MNINDMADSVDFAQMAAEDYCKDIKYNNSEKPGEFKPLDFEIGAVKGREAGEELRKVMSSISANDTSFELISSGRKPKCKKFHQNLRSQLNTGGIKWRN